jgi:hypothetical protein
MRHIFQLSKSHCLPEPGCFTRAIDVEDDLLSAGSITQPAGLLLVIQRALEQIFEKERAQDFHWLWGEGR